MALSEDIMGLIQVVFSKGVRLDNDVLRKLRLTGRGSTSSRDGRSLEENQVQSAAGPNVGTRVAKGLTTQAVVGLDARQARELLANWYNCRQTCSR